MEAAMDVVVDRNNRIIDDPPFIQKLLSRTRWAWIYVPFRLYLAYVWIPSGWGKLTNPAWMQTGEALKGFWERAVVTDPRPVIAADWYRAFIQFLLDTQAYTWMGKVIPIAEFAVGIGLLLGIFTGIAAFGGALLNYNFLLAGTVSSNPILLILEVFIMAGWKVAGWWGLDRWLLPRLGVPWALSRTAPAPPAPAVEAS
jgi:thiosulfate dehydrogenase [quinone] large subunit